MARRKPNVLSLLFGVAGILIILAALGFSAVKWRDLQDWYAQYRVENYIRHSQAASRNTAGRLSGAPYATYEPNVRFSDELGRAQLLSLRLPNSPRSHYLHSLIDIASAN